MKTSRAWAPVNIALIKHWGYRDGEPGKPARASLSLTLEHGATTVVRPSEAVASDTISVNGERLSEADGDKAAAAYELLRAIRAAAGYPNTRLAVESRSEVPLSAGMASSAAGAAALTLAALDSAGLLEGTSRAELMEWCCRAGSLSGLRSLAGGVVHLAVDGGELRIEDVPNPSLDLVVLSALVDVSSKRVPSTEGHLIARTSPLWADFESVSERRVAAMRSAFEAGDFSTIGRLAERDALEMHEVMSTSRPSAVVTTERTWSVLRLVGSWRAEGLQGYCTLDAGPNPHVLCRREDAAELERRLRALPEVGELLGCGLCDRGAHLL